MFCFLAGITLLVNRILFATLHFHLQCISWIIFLANYLEIECSFQADIALYPMEFHCKVLHEILLAIIFELGRCACSTHKTLYKICSQELTRILLIFHFELNFNKCPLQPVFDRKKGFPGHLLHAKKNKHEITNPKRSGTLPQKCFHVWSYLWLSCDLCWKWVSSVWSCLWLTCDPCWTCVSFVWSYLWLTCDPCWNPNNICFWE